MTIPQALMANAKKKSDIKNASQYLSIHFNNQGIVTRIDGRDSLPDTRH